MVKWEYALLQRSWLISKKLVRLTIGDKYFNIEPKIEPQEYPILVEKIRSAVKDFDIAQFVEVEKKGGIIHAYRTDNKQYFRIQNLIMQCLGSEGWDLCSTSAFDGWENVYFKREIKPIQEPE